MSRILAATFVLLAACGEPPAAPQLCTVVRVRGVLYYQPTQGPPIELTRGPRGVRILLPADSYTGAETEWETEARTLDAEPDEVECVAPAP